MEGLILLLAVLGPGRRHPDQTLIARFFLDDPSFLQAVGVNWIALHVVMMAAFFAAWIVKRRKTAEAARRKAGLNLR